MIRITRMAIVTLAFMLCLACLVFSGTAFADRCVDNGDGTVTDNGTGLMWQKAIAGRMNWDDAMSYASGLSLGGHSDWRLPNRDELNGLYHYHSPCKDMMEEVSSSYWSSTTHASYTSFAMIVFYLGGGGPSMKSNSRYVRAVRSAQ